MCQFHSSDGIITELNAELVFLFEKKKLFTQQINAQQVMWHNLKQAVDWNKTTCGSIMVRL